MASNIIGLMPAQVTVDTWASIEDLREFAGLQVGVMRALLAELGDETCNDPRILASIGHDMMRTAVATCQVNTATGPRALSAMEKSRCNIWYAAARRKHNLELVDIIATPVAAPGPAAPAVPGPAAPPTIVRRIRISTVMNQASDMEVDLLGAAELADKRRNYKTIMGDNPRDECEATDVQLSAFSRVNQAGLNPVADFGVWGPFGERTERVLKFKTFVQGVDGYKMAELPGAGNLEAWQACWEIYKTAAIIDGAAAPATLDRYAGEFAAHCRRYPDCWGICAQADIRARTELWPQLRRRLEAFHLASPQLSTFDVQMPWNSVIRESVGSSALDFWDFQLREPARLFLLNGPKQLDLSNHFAPAGTHVRPPTLKIKKVKDRKGKGKGKDSKGKGKGADDSAAQRKDGRYIRSQDGTEICYSWTRDPKGCVDGQCPNKRAHVCEWCRGQHRSVHCKEHVTDNKHK